MRCCRLGRDTVAALTVGVALSACAADRRGSTDDVTPVLPATSASPSELPAAAPPAGPTRPAASSPASTRSAAPGAVDVPVIVTLSVNWQPENVLLDHEIDGQRVRVRQAEEEVLRDLGTHGRLRRQLHQSGQTALLVDAVGLDLLRRHPLVAAVQEDRAAPAGAG